MSCLFMDIRRIRAEDLKVRNFVFMEMSEASEREWRGQPLTFDGVVFGFCTCGHSDFRLDYKVSRISAGELFVLLPGHIFTTLESTADFEMRLLLVSRDFLYSLPVSFDFDWLKVVETSPCFRLDDRTMDDLTGVYSIQERYASDEKYSLQIRNSLIMSLIIIIISAIDSRRSEKQTLVVSRSERLTHDFFDLMLQNYESQRRVSFYADKLCVTPKNLAKVVKGVTGHSVQEWINEVVVIEAKRCLKTSDMSVFQISERLHFTTPPSFVRFFRQHTGFTPLEYRKK